MRLNRLKTSGVHYVFAKHNGKQFSVVGYFEIKLVPVKWLGITVL
jgi:hypothetical protein